MNRRTLIRAGATLGVLATAGTAGAYRLLPPRRSRVLLPPDELARDFVASLDPTQRAEVCVPYDHPLRQYHNRGVWGGGRSIFTGFGRAQRQLLTDLLHSGLSDTGRALVPNEFFVNLPGVHSMRVLVCGDPQSPPYQLILTGPHLNLRIGGKSREGVAFGGPQVYGDQRGDGRVGLPGNLYRPQFLLGMQLYRSLDPVQQREALLERAPIQTEIEPRGRAEALPGTPLAGSASASHALARELVTKILATYPSDDGAYAWQCLERNGGIAALSFSVYADGEVDGSGEYQIFRLEGPAAVFHFRGAPHVHAFVNVAMEGDEPLSLGESLGENPAPLEGVDVQRLFELAMKSETGADLAWYPADAVAGRLRAGTIRTGDIYTLESWQDSVTVAAIRGSRLAPGLAERLSSDAHTATKFDPGRLVRVAAPSDLSGRAARESLGEIEASEQGPLLRDITIAYLRAHGFVGLESRSG